jgi:solute carrier family 25 (mitochondrial phosphate transporter), member 23/24/25/41
MRKARFLCSHTGTVPPILVLPSVLHAVFLGGSSASAATYPLDMLRTRLAASKASNPQLLTMLREVIHNEGASALYKGMGTTLLCQGFNIALNFAIYETLQVNIIEIERRVLKDMFGVTADPSKQRGSWLSSLMCGAVSGCVASFTIFPLDLIRRRQQANSGAKISAREVFTKIVKSEGWRGLYRGIAPELVKVVPAVGINFYAYELIRQEILGVQVAPR